MRILYITLLSCLLVQFAFAKPVNADKDRLALDGYDAVAFHTESKAVKGESTHEVQLDGVKYYFSSAENVKIFKENPDKYLPAYGGYCAWGLAEKGKLYPVDIDTWQVEDGVLYLNYNKRVKKKFNKNLDGFIKEANQQWNLQ